MMDDNWIDRALAALREWNAAVQGDSGDAELEAGSELADLVREIVADTGPKYPEGTPEYAEYFRKLRVELRKWENHEPPYDTDV